MNLPARTDAPRLTLALAVVYRFSDIFTGAVVRAPLAVTIPSLKWTAFASLPDATYRFVGLPAAPGTLPHSFAVTVESVNGDYASYEPFAVTLPLTLPPGPPQRATYLVEKPLWPTRRLRPPPGETAVIGQITSTAGQPLAGLKVYLSPDVIPPVPTGPYAYSDVHGDFLCRLPDVKATLDASSAVIPVTLNLQVFDGSTPVSVTPSTIAGVVPGALIFQPFTRT